jgi:hypothetical protein
MSNKKIKMKNSSPLQAILMPWWCAGATMSTLPDRSRHSFKPLDTAMGNYLLLICPTDAMIIIFGSKIVPLLLAIFTVMATCQ